ncbi:hypothetical protein EVAR_33082_1 [Eumeta japonica]|uniref:Uncharacterized protein n=1 Tax=Eumeta variegata TaxID=151549 RepID=A0A4C2A5H6_EUMVA|nr:hypothetical protein EVAR_33082_1 [Eumeta japonica]
MLERDLYSAAKILSRPQKHNKTHTDTASAIAMQLAIETVRASPANSGAPNRYGLDYALSYALRRSPRKGSWYRHNLYASRYDLPAYATTFSQARTIRGSWGVMTPGLGLCLTIVIELGPVLTEPRMGDPPSPSPTSKAGSECAMTNLYGREKPIL